MTTALRILLLCLFVLAVAAPAWYGAKEAGAAPCGEVRPQPLVSWWCIAPGASVRVEGGQWGVNREEGSVVAVLWAQGAWRSVEVDGVTVAGEHRVWLPAVHGVVGNGP